MTAYWTHRPHRARPGHPDRWSVPPVREIARWWAGTLVQPLAPGAAGPMLTSLSGALLVGHLAPQLRRGCRRPQRPPRSSPHVSSSRGVFAPPTRPRGGGDPDRRSNAPPRPSLLSSSPPLGVRVFRDRRVRRELGIGQASGRRRACRACASHYRSSLPIPVHYDWPYSEEFYE